jgi:hypothetical protein
MGSIQFLLELHNALEPPGTLNVQRSTFNVQRSTFTPNVQRSSFKGKPSTINRLMGSGQFHWHCIMPMNPGSAGILAGMWVEFGAQSPAGMPALPVQVHGKRPRPFVRA